MADVDEVVAELEAVLATPPTPARNARARKLLRKLERRDPERAAALEARLAPARPAAGGAAWRLPEPPAPPAPRPCPASWDGVVLGDPAAPDGVVTGLIAAWRTRVARTPRRGLGDEQRRLAAALDSAARLARRRGTPDARALATAAERVGAAKGRAVRDALDEVDRLAAYPMSLVVLQPHPAPIVATASDLGSPPPGRGTVDRPAMAALIGQLDRSGPWVDLGCGDGASTVGIAARLGVDDVVGVDTRSATVADPHARFVRLTGGGPAELADETLAAVGAASASVVSLLYPLHHGSGASITLAPPLATALALLRPRGWGWLVTEDPTALGAAVAELAADPRVGSLFVGRELLGLAQLAAFGITPYAPRRSEIAPAPAADRDARAGTFTWGLGCWFERLG